MGIVPVPEDGVAMHLSRRTLPTDRRRRAGSGVCYVKFAAVPPGPRAAGNFSQLLDACEFLAGACGAQKITLGVNLARREAFRELSERGFRTEMQGVAMETGDASAGYNHAGVYILDDWR